MKWDYVARTAACNVPYSIIRVTQINAQQHAMVINKRTKTSVSKEDLEKSWLSNKKSHTECPHNEPGPSL